MKSPSCPPASLAFLFPQLPPALFLSLLPLSPESPTSFHYCLSFPISDITTDCNFTHVLETQDAEGCEACFQCVGASSDFVDFHFSRVWEISLGTEESSLVRIQPPEYTDQASQEPEV